MNQIKRQRLNFSVFLSFGEWIKPALRKQTLDYSGLEILEKNTQHLIYNYFF